jgi:hypothetical protein
LTDYYRVLPAENLPPERILSKKYDYLILSWRDKNDLGKQIDLFRAANGKKIELIKRFPENADDDTISYDLQGWFWHPYVNLPKVKFIGPVVDIYKII